MLRRNRTIGIIGAIIVVFTLSAFFLLSFERIALYLWALTFLLIAEIILCTGLIAIRSLDANHNRVFIRSGITSSLFLYFAATLIIVLFVRQFENKLHTFILFQLGIIAFFAIIILLLLIFSRRIANQDCKTIDDRKCIDACEKRVYDLLSDNKNIGYRNDLNKLYNSLKYSDKIGSSSVDDKIESQIALLESALGNTEKDKNHIMKLFSEISTFINQRTGEISRLKRGSF